MGWRSRGSLKYGNYKNLFTTIKEDHCPLVTRISFLAIQIRDKELLVRKVSFLKMRKVVFNMGVTKTFGTNGFPILFYQANWKKVGSYLFHFVREVFERKISAKNVN